MWVLTSTSRSCFVPVFTYWNVNGLLPLIKIIKCMIEYFIGPITLGPGLVAPERRLQMSAWAIQQIIPGKRRMPRLLENVRAVVPRCWLTYAPGVSLGKGVMMLCDGLYIKLYISSKHNSNWWWMRWLESCWESLLSPLKGVTLYTMENPHSPLGLNLLH